VQRAALKELHYIAPVDNLPSIVSQGLLSHKRAGQVSHVSVALAEVQDRRAKVVIPGGRPLHEYVNLYINARNPMLYLRTGEHDRLVVLRVSTAVLDLPGVVVTDRNAARNWARFEPAPDGLSIVDQDLTFATYWTHPDQVEQYNHAGAMCAEVLVPDRIDVRYIVGAYANRNEVVGRAQKLLGSIPVSLNSKMFFR
jgi:hypothetical protein